MPSRAERPPGDRARRPVEWALRAVALAAIGLALLETRRPVHPPARRTADGRPDRARLEEWTRRPADDLRVSLDTVPDEVTRAWLRALRAAGTRVHWSGALTPGAITVTPLPRPGGRVEVSVAAPAGARVAVSDAGGVLDTLIVTGVGATLEARGVAGVVVAEVGGSRARAAVPDSLRVHPVLVVGRAGWEAKFVLIALEEQGWRVAARLAVAPGRVVEESAPTAPDTGRYAAVIVVDSGAAPPGIARFVREGGGVVVAGDAAADPALLPLLPARAGDVVPGVAGALDSPMPRRGLALRPLGALQPAAVPIERRDELLAAAARRVGAGRVAQLGYVDSWQWRMLGGEAAVAAHGAWWSNVVGSVAHAPTPGLPPAGGDAAPYERLVDALGPPSVDAGTSATHAAAPPGRLPPALLFAVALLALLGEWLSRRLRGAP